MSGAEKVGWAHPHLPNEGKTSEWYTPPHVFDALGLTFDLDPCAPPGGVPWVPATRHYSENGLQRGWNGRVWLNPPYGKKAGRWVCALADHGWGIALVFSRTDVRWWHQAVPRASAVFHRGPVDVHRWCWAERSRQLGWPIGTHRVRRRLCSCALTIRSWFDLRHEIAVEPH